MDHNSRDPISLHGRDSSIVLSVEQNLISADNANDNAGDKSVVNSFSDKERRLNPDSKNTLVLPFQAAMTVRPIRSHSMSDYPAAYNSAMNGSMVHTLPTQSLPTIASTGFALVNSKSANSFTPFIPTNGMHLSNGTLYGSSLIGGPPLLSSNMRSDVASFTDYYRFPNPSVLNMGGPNSLSDGARDSGSSAGPIDMAKYTNVPFYYPANSHPSHPHLTYPNTSSDIYLSNGFHGEELLKPSHGPISTTTLYPPSSVAYPSKINPMLQPNGPFFNSTGNNMIQRSHSSSDIHESYRPASSISVNDLSSSTNKGRTNKKTGSSKKDSNLASSNAKVVPPKMKDDQPNQHMPSSSTKEGRSNSYSDMDLSSSSHLSTSFNGHQYNGQLPYAQMKNDREKIHVSSTDECSSSYAPHFDSLSGAMNGESTIQVASKTQKPRPNNIRNPKQSCGIKGGSRAKAVKGTGAMTAPAGPEANADRFAESEKSNTAMTTQHDTHPSKAGNKRSKKFIGGADPEKDKKTGATSKEVRKSSTSRRDAKARADSIANSVSEISVQVRTYGEKDRNGSIPTVEKLTGAAALTRRRDRIRARLSSITTESFLSNNICASFLPLIEAQATNDARSSVVGTTSSSYNLHAPIAFQGHGGMEQKKYFIGGRVKTHRDYLLEEVQWLALDFRQELRWKLNASRSVADALCTPDSSCSQRLTTVKLNHLDMDGSSLESVALAQSAARSVASESVALAQSAARSVASTLSTLVLKMWEGWEHNILGSSEKDVVLDSLLRCSHVCSRVSGDGDKPVELSSEQSSLEHEVDRVLSIPLLLNDDGSFKRDFAGSNGLVHHTATVPAPSSVIVLQKHQESLLLKVQAINQLGFGAGVYGKSYGGKTMALCFLIQNWLSQQECSSLDAAFDKVQSKVVILIAARKSVFRWISEFRRLQSFFAAVLWSSSFNPSERSFVGSTLIVVPLESLQSFLASSFLNQVIQQDGPSLNGLLLDVRGQEIDPKSSTNETAGSTVQEDLIELTSQLHPSFVNRCVLSELSFLSDSHLHILHFLMPMTAISQWTRKYTTSDEDSNANLINRNTLVQLLFNLSIHVEVPSTMDALAHSKIVEETIPAAMDGMQLHTYNCIMSQIKHSPSSLDGADTEKLAKALVLLSKACFHASLLTVCPDSCSDAASITGEKFKGKQEQENFFDDVIDGKYFDSNAEGSRSRRSNTFAVGPLGRACVLEQVHNFSGTFNEHCSLFEYGRKVPLNKTNGSGSYSVFGSGKLTCLLTLLVRYSGSKIAIVTQNFMEIQLVHLLLASLRINHLQAGFHKSKCVNGMDRITEWLKAQRAVERFNGTSGSSRILLCTKEMFEAPSLVPERASVVIMLSEEWTDRIDVKDCFRLRLVSAGCNGSTLTVVRVVASQTIEEVMARRDCSFLQLQGMVLPNFYVKSSDRRMSNHSVEDVLLIKAPLLRSAISSANGKVLKSSADIKDASSFTSCPTPTSQDPQDHSDGEGIVLQPSVKRGRGKGIIALCRQGGTSFVKDRRTLQELGLISARPSIVLAITNMKIATSVDSTASDWIDALRYHVQALENRLSSVNELVGIDYNSSAESAEANADDVSSIMTKDRQPLNETKTRSGHHYFLTNPTAKQDFKNESVEDEMNALNSFNDSIESPALDDVSRAANNSQGDALCNEPDISRYARKGRIRFLDALDRMFMEAYCNLLVNKSSSKHNGHSVHVSVVKHLHAKWRTVINGLDDVFFGTTTDNSNSPSNAKQLYDSEDLDGDYLLRRSAGTGAVLGKSTAEIQLSQLFLPFPHRFTSIESISTGKAGLYDEFQQWPKSYHFYRYLPSLLKRAGATVQPFLSVNPLQTAARLDFITSESYQATTACTTDISVHCAVNNNSSATIASNSTATSAIISRGNRKSKRPRPSTKGSSSAKSVEESVDWQDNPSLLDDAEDVVIPARRKKAHRDNKDGSQNNQSKKII